MKKWNGLCPAGKHGLDHKGQQCDLCAGVKLRITGNYLHGFAVDGRWFPMEYQARDYSRRPHE